MKKKHQVVIKIRVKACFLNRKEQNVGRKNIYSGIDHTDDLNCGSDEIYGLNTVTGSRD